jgi:hypothetical protein
MKRLMRVPEAHRYLQMAHGVRLSEKTLRQWVFLRKVASTRVGGMVYIQAESLDEMVQESPAIQR